MGAPPEGALTLGTTNVARGMLKLGNLLSSPSRRATGRDRGHRSTDERSLRSHLLLLFVLLLSSSGAKPRGCRRSRARSGAR
jgi:hypothetical protein